MVQIILYISSLLATYYSPFISHMVQIILFSLSDFNPIPISFISHMVQIILSQILKIVFLF